MDRTENGFNERIVGAKEVCRISGLSRSTLWRYEKTGNFPRHRKLGPGRVGWKISEIQSWIESRQEVAA
jgi:predicted DNA-binding transcriptional regulator AlpA